MESDDDDAVPTVMAGGKTVPITDINEALMDAMTPAEKESYIQISQEYYSNMFD